MDDSCYTLLIVGGADDPEILRCLEEFPKHTTHRIVSLLLGSEEAPMFDYDLSSDRLLVDGETIEPVAVFIRYNIYAASPSEEQRFRRYHHLIQGWLLIHPEVAVLNRAWLNRFGNKVAQLRFAEEVGFNIPKSRVSNLRRKIDRPNKIVKPIDHGRCRRSEEVGRRIDHQNLSRLNRKCYESVVATPVFIQPRLAGTEWRVYYIDGEIFTFKIESEMLDYRFDPEVVPQFVDELPEEIAHRVRTLCRRLELDYAALDFKTEQPDDARWLFLEVNDFPMFAAFDRVADGALARAVVVALEQRAGNPSLLLETDSDEKHDEVDGSASDEVPVDGSASDEVPADGSASDEVPSDGSVSDEVPVGGSAGEVVDGPQKFGPLHCSTGSGISPPSDSGIEG